VSVRRQLPIAIMLLLGGCGTLTNRYAPEVLAEAPLPPGSGLILFSTGAPHKCQQTATYLNLLPEGASVRDKPIASASVDAYIVKSDFADHQGNLHAIPVPAGNYYFTPWTDNPLVRSVLQPKASFSVAAGETVYLGEYYMPQACTLSALYEVHDQATRDLPLLESKAPRLDSANITKRLMVLSGGVPPCDASNSELSCHP
jgi:hypothetical protein